MGNPAENLNLGKRVLPLPPSVPGKSLLQVFFSGHSVINGTSHQRTKSLSGIGFSLKNNFNIDVSNLLLLFDAEFSVKNSTYFY